MGLMGVTIDEQKEIIRIIVSKSNQTSVESMFLAGNLDTRGKGIMWMVKLDKWQRISKRCNERAGN